VACGTKLGAHGPAQFWLRMATEASDRVGDELRRIDLGRNKKVGLIRLPWDLSTRSAASGIKGLTTTPQIRSCQKNTLGQLKPEEMKVEARRSHGGAHSRARPCRFAMRRDEGVGFGGAPWRDGLGDDGAMDGVAPKPYRRWGPAEEERRQRRRNI
jgi:hypothetical protein